MRRSISVCALLVAAMFLVAPAAAQQDTVTAIHDSMRSRLAKCGLGIGDEYDFGRLVRNFGPVGSNSSNAECARIGAQLRVAGEKNCDAVMHNFIARYGRCIDKELIKKALPEDRSAQQ